MASTALDLSCSDYQYMADVVRDIRNELKKRNPIFVNAYTGLFDEAAAILEYLHERKSEDSNYDEEEING